MSERNIEWESPQGITESMVYERDEVTLRHMRLTESSSVKVIRSKLGLSQAAFAAVMRVNERTVQDWEEGRAQPRGAVKALLRIAEAKPDMFLKLTSKSR